MSYYFGGCGWRTDYLGCWFVAGKKSCINVFDWFEFLCFLEVCTLVISVRALRKKLTVIQTLNLSYEILFYM